MQRRTTIEIDEELLARAKRALGQKTTRATVEAALRLASKSVEDDRALQAERQQLYFEHLATRADPDVLLLGEMWR